MKNNTDIKNILNNHEKLLSMIDSKMLPIKEVLLKDVEEIKSILETASKKEKYNETKRNS